MPVYEYDCSQCGTFDAMGQMSTSGAPAPCPDCGSSAARVLSAPRLTMLSSNQRRAHERNEKSAHEPRRRQKHVCGSGCQHQAGNKPSPLRQTPGKRPWMLGH